MTSALSQAINFYGYLFTSPFGFVGHTCRLITFLSKPLRTTSTGFLFIFLTISNLLYLLIYIRDFIVQSLAIATIQSEHLCRFRTFTINLAMVSSSWLLVLIAVDRMIRARFPHRTRQLCTRRIAAYSVITVYLCSAAFTSHVLQPAFAFVIPRTNWCGLARSSVTSYSLFYSNVWPILQTIVTYIIPSCLMTFSLISTYLKVRAQRTVAMTFVRQDKHQRQMLMLMIASVVFFVMCTLPYSINRIINFRSSATSDILLVLAILSTFLNINASFTFYLHCLTSHLFRQTFIGQLKRLYMCLNRQKGPYNANTVHPLSTTVKPVSVPLPGVTI